MDDQERKLFRAALGRFATGVTIVTTRDQSGDPVGITANSFNSVSLDPPMILWSLAKSAYSLKAFSEAEHFAVHILSSDQQELSNTFARRGENKFDGLELEPGPAPLLGGCTARIVCKTAFQYEGGDHIIFVGEVIDYTEGSGPPLLFLEGRYAEARRPGEDAPDRIDPERAHIGSQSLTHLLARSYVQITRRIHHDLVACDMRQPRLMIMIAIEQHQAPSREEIKSRVEANGYAVADEDIDQLIALEWLSDTNGVLHLTHEGRAHFHEALSRMRDFEDSFCEGLSEGEMSEVRHALEHIIEATDDGAMRLV